MLPMARGCAERSCTGAGIHTQKTHAIQPRYRNPGGCQATSLPKGSRQCSVWYVLTTVNSIVVLKVQSTGARKGYGG